MKSLAQNGFEIDLAQLCKHGGGGIPRSPVGRITAQHRRLRGRIARPANCRRNGIASLIAIDDARGTRAALLPRADIHRRHIRCWRLDDTAGRITDYDVGLSQGSEIKRLPERGDQHRTPGMLPDEPIQPLRCHPGGRDFSE